MAKRKKRFKRAHPLEDDILYAKDEKGKNMTVAHFHVAEDRQIGVSMVCISFCEMII